MQLTLNTIATASLGLLAALAFQPILITNRAFILSSAITYPSGAYAFWLAMKGGCLHILAALIGIAVAAVISVILDFAFIRRFRLAALPNWKMLVATLGLFVLGQNILSLAFGDDVTTLRNSQPQIGIAIFGAHVASIQLLAIACAFVVVMIFWLIFGRTDLGRSIRAVSSNPELAINLGHDTERIRLYAALIGGSVAGLAGILTGLDTGVTPMIGFRLLLNGIVIIVIAGVDGILPMLGGALFLAALQNVAALFLGAAWMDAVAFVLLISFLIWKPLGISGRRLKKVEI